jgi:SAM-dependent methyltransferase
LLPTVRAQSASVPVARRRSPVFAGVSPRLQDVRDFMNNGWNESAAAWIELLGGRGDWGREHVLDAAMLRRVQGGRFHSALDVGCGEGRFCRLLQQNGIATIGVDPTVALLQEARRRDSSGDYRLGRAEKLEFEDERFDLVVSYLTLIDIPDFRTAIAEMARVLRRRGRLLVANITSFTSACAAQGWIRDAEGRLLCYPLDRYLEEFALWLEWKGMKIENWHRPLGAYMAAFLDQGLTLRCFEEPEPVGGDPDRAARYRRAPWFVVMEWEKQAATSG